MSLLHDLHTSLARRIAPENIVQLIVQGMGDRLSPGELKVLGKATLRASQSSSMPQEFWKPADIKRQAKVAAALIPAVTSPEAGTTPESLLEYVDQLGQTFARRLGDTDFRQNRRNREARREVGLGGMSKRQYNKRFRLLQRMERKVHKLSREWTKADLAQIARSRLACRLTPEDLGTDLDTAAFVAYLTATLNRRSVFTAGSQELAFDEIADLFMKRLKASAAANWWAVAHVLPDTDVVGRLTDEQKGRLLGMWHAALVASAGILQLVNATCEINHRTMVVQRGNDSSTWNAAAGAWNKTRDGYLALLYALDLDEVWERQCLGKVPRLMAGDVTAWHMTSGGDICHPDVKVWAELPRPWEVLDGRASCTRQEVEAACRRHGVDPARGGWTVPRDGNREVAAFCPTPELVHGVAVTSPQLAAVLRKAGWFSGKEGKPLPDGTSAVNVVRDPHGFALSARPEIEALAETDAD